MIYPESLCIFGASILKMCLFDKNYYLLLIQIKLNNLMENLCMHLITNKNEEYIGKIDIKKNIDNYFCFNNFNFDKNKNIEKGILILTMDSIFDKFSKYCSEVNSEDKEKYEKNLIESLFEKEKIQLSGNNILKVMKFCVKYNINCKNIFKKFQLLKDKKTPIQKEYLLSDEDLDY